MSFQFIKQMPTPEKVKTDYPISPELAKIKECRDAEIKKVFTGENDKFLPITKTLLLIIATVLQRFRKKLRIK